MTAAIVETWNFLASRYMGLVALHAPSRFRSALCVGIFCSVGAAVGWAAWGRSESLWSLLGLLLLPLMWGRTRTRGQGLALMLGYYLTGARGLPVGAVVFFGDMAPLWWGIAMWFGVSMLLSLPFAICWSRSYSKRAAGFVLSMFVCLVPPLGIVGWLNPLSVAGILFPHAGWLGLVLTIVLFIALVLRMGRLVTALAVIVAISNTWVWCMEPPVQKGWRGLDTSFPRLSSAGADQESQFLASAKRIEWLQEVIADMPADATLVLPETVMGRWDGVAQEMLAQSEGVLLAKNSKVLVGAEIPGSGEEYQNAVVVLGAQGREQRAAVQGIPVPLSMWKPWAKDGAEADLLARGNTINVGGQRVGVSICYEQLLAYSLLRLAWDKPVSIAAVSNVWWARATNIPQIQFQSVHVFARLFGVPVVTARNI